MTPIVALFICIAFVFFLLRLDKKQSHDVTRALWIPTIWMIYIAGKPLAYWFPLSGATPESSPLDRTFLIILFCMALWILFQRKFDWFSAINENIWVIVLIVFMLISILWSDNPNISLNRLPREVLAVLMAFVVLSEPSPHQAVESILRRTSYILIPFSLLLIKYFPHYGITFGRWSGQAMWIGVTMHKNGLSRLCIIVGFFLIWSLVRRRKENKMPVWKYLSHVEIFILVLTFRLMAGEGGYLFNSATSIYSLCMGLLVYFVFHLKKKSKNILRTNAPITIVAIIIIFGIASVLLGGTIVGFFASTSGRDATLTGRTDVWEALLPYAMQHPIVGHGSGGFWTPRTRDLFKITDAHNGYLDIFLGLGVIGVLLISMFFLSSCRKAQRGFSHNFDWSTLCICYIVMAAVHNIGESSIDSLTSFLTAIILFLSVSSTNNFSSKR